MTTPDTRDSVERIVAEMLAVGFHEEIFGERAHDWADRLSAIPQQAGGEDAKDAALVLSNARTHLPTEVKTAALGTMTRKECAIFDEGYNAALQRARNLLDMPADAIRRAMERGHD